VKESLKAKASLRRCCGLMCRKDPESKGKPATTTAAVVIVDEDVKETVKVKASLPPLLL
jgi:hypothetical protein